MLVFVGIFALICFLFGFGMFFGIVKKIKEITAVWDSMEGTITKSEVAETTKATRTDGGGSYRYYGADIAYEYRVNGVKHSSRTIYSSDAAERVITDEELEAAEENDEPEEAAVFENGDRNRSIIEDAVAQYPKGSRVKVFYNPKNPEQSYLEKVSGKSSIGYIVMLFFVGLVLLGFGLVMLLFILNGGQPLG